MLLKDDNELVYEVIHGSISSFEVLIDRYQKPVFNMILHMVGDMETAKDLSQNVFVKAFENLGKFNPAHRFFSWLYRIAVNETIDFNRKIRKTESLEAIVATPTDTSGPEDHESRSHLLHQEMRKMIPEYRLLILLKYFSGLSYEEISEIMAIPVDKVRSRLFIARQQLRSGLVSNRFFENE